MKQLQISEALEIRGFFIYIQKMYILGNAVLFLLFAGVKGHFLFSCRYCILYMRINLKRKEHAGGQAEPDQWASVVRIIQRTHCRTDLTCRIKLGQYSFIARVRRARTNTHRGAELKEREP